MIYSELPLAFPWYDSLLKQNRFRKNCLHAVPFKLITPMDALLPFQFCNPNTELKAVVEWKILNEDGLPVKDLHSDIGKLNNKIIDGKQYTYYKGDQLNLSLPCGYYYSKIRFQDSNSYYYSELFFIGNFLRDSNPDLLRITYKHTCDIGPIKYTSLDTDYQNVFFLDSFITHSEPAYLEEVEKDGFGNETVVFNKYQNRFETQAVVPDFLKTAVVVIQLHKSVSVVTNNGLNTIAINRLMVKAAIMELSGGCESSVDLTFESNC